MGEKNKKNGGEQQKEKEAAENKKKETGGGINNIATIVLKADLHCEGCVAKVLKCIRSFDGVESANICGEQKITVVGKVDPVKLRARVEQKTHKKIELVSPQPKKDEKNADKSKGKENNGVENSKQEKNKESNDKNPNPKMKSDEKKPKEKESSVATAVLKVHLHCEGCTQKIHKIISKTKGYRDVKIDKQKELVMVTGTMDMKALTEVLKKHLKRDVQIVPPAKKEDGQKKENAGGEKGKNSGDKGKNGGEKGKSGDRGEGGEKGLAGGVDEKVDKNRVKFQVGDPYPTVYEPGIAVDQYPFQHNPNGFGQYQMVHAPQLFSDENPNACSVM